MAKQLHSKQVELLGNYTIQSVEISCTKCGKTIYEMDADDYQAIKEFIRKGWRATEKHCYCPECAEKHTKIEIEFPRPAWGGGMFGDD
jgi:hypothetical protein